MASILMVDDKESIREVVREILEDQGHTVFEVANGEDAIAVMTEQPIDVVILDINMPVTGGWETLRIIKDEENGWPNSKIIMLTVQNTPEAAIKAWGLGATYYVPKPFRTSDLVETVQKALTE